MPNGWSSSATRLACTLGRSGGVGDGAVAGGGLGEAEEAPAEVADGADPPHAAPSMAATREPATSPDRGGDRDGVATRPVVRARNGVGIARCEPADLVGRRR